MSATRTGSVALAAIGLSVALAGCAFLLPHERAKVEGRWGEFVDAKTAFDVVRVGETTESELQKLGFHPFEAPNVEILDYVDLVARFVPEPIPPESLTQGFRRCIAAGAECRGYEASISQVRRERYGIALLDVLRFRRQTRTHGWRFQGLFLLVNGVVVEKLWSGTPHIVEDTDERRPLGPFQDPLEYLGMIPF